MSERLPITRRAMNLGELLVQAARRHGERDAVVHGDRRWTWRELHADVGALAAELRAAGARPGDAVLVHSPNHVELIQAMFACWFAGAVFVPTNFRLTPAEVVDLAEVARPVAWIGHADYPEHAAAVAEAVPGLRLHLSIAGGGSDSVASAVARRRGEAVRPAPVGRDDPCWYFFTSGTSGRPKAAVLGHDQMGFVVTNHLCDLMPGTDHRDASLAVAPLSHGAGIHFLTQVARAAKTVLPAADHFDPAEAWRLVETERISNMFTVPTILKRLVEHPAVRQHDHRGLRHVIYAGAPMYRSDQLRALEELGPVLVQYYGLGEVTGNITVLPPEDHERPLPDGLNFGSCGVARVGMQISIQDETGRELPARQQGEICVCGPAVFHGYLNNPEANAASFRDGWFRTGDLGMLDEEGFLYITGRVSEMYISGGSNIHPREIEEKILAHPGITEAAVVGVPDPEWGEVGVAVCVPRPGGELTAAALRDWLAPQMSRYKMPKRLLFWDELPKSGYGKIAKRAIKDRLAADRAESA
ncbi:acyl-CoA synthetase [Saccharopolyspora sp. NPDC050389]|uniref:acyl-CoA synthetase n=1 Tax=Saccharopolyspora sp. NPDC050389 TaxID=3155516 RepID=UPI0033CD551A